VDDRGEAARTPEDPRREQRDLVDARDLAASPLDELDVFGGQGRVHQSLERLGQKDPAERDDVGGLEHGDEPVDLGVTEHGATHADEHRDRRDRVGVVVLGARQKGRAVEPIRHDGPAPGEGLVGHETHQGDRESQEVGRVRAGADGLQHRVRQDEQDAAGERDADDPHRDELGLPVPVRVGVVRRAGGDLQAHRDGAR